MVDDHAACTNLIAMDAAGNPLDAVDEIDVEAQADFYEAASFSPSNANLKDSLGFII